jgi:putative redox protein
MRRISSRTERPGAFRQVIEVDASGHTLFADSDKEGGGGETAPGPHDLFDASLAACKALTSHWYARQKGYPLERVVAVVGRDDSKEREGHYQLTVTLDFQGPLTAEQRTRLLAVAAKCPVHKLMTTVEIAITTDAAPKPT